MRTTRLHACGPACTEHRSGLLIPDSLKPSVGLKPRLRLTTPVSRPHNLAYIERNPELARAKEHFDVTWHVLMDCFTMKWPVEKTLWEAKLPWAKVENVLVERAGRGYGEDLLNFVLDDMDDDEWHFGFADDSVPETGVFAALRRAIDDGADAVVFPMEIHGRLYPADPKYLLPCYVSGGQLAVRRDVVGGLRWEPGHLALDGIFIQRLYDRTAGVRKWTFLKEPVLTHNQFRPEAS